MAQHCQNPHLQKLRPELSIVLLKLRYHSVFFLLKVLKKKGRAADVANSAGHTINTDEFEELRSFFSKNIIARLCF